MAANSSSDSLWICVMDTVVRRHPGSSGYWRLAPTNQADCSLCQEVGGVLIRCATERCKKEYHLDCAFHQGGLSLSEEGNLTFHCESHFKPVLFCSCNERYDETRDYISCDSCCEWFHNACVGLKDYKEAAVLDNFICPSCVVAQRDGKNISAFKQKNLEKERLSSCHLTAIKAVGILVEIAGSICPMIDQLQNPVQPVAGSSTRAKAESISSSHIACRVFSSKDICDSADYLSNPIFMQDEDGNENEEDDETGGGGQGGSVDRPDNFGTASLISSWRQRMIDESSKYNEWSERAQYVSLRAAVPLQSAHTSLSAESTTSIVELSEEVNQLADTLETIPCSQKEAEHFNSFKSAIDWARQFLELLHTTDKTEDWLDDLFALIRGSTPYIRRLSASDKESLSICETILPAFQRLVKAATASVTEVTEWVNHVDNKLLSRWEKKQQQQGSDAGDSEAMAVVGEEDEETLVVRGGKAKTTITLAEVEDLAQKAAVFPSQPPELEQLADLVDEARGVEGTITAAMQNDSISAEEIRSIEKQMARLPLLLPSAEKFSRISDTARFLAEYTAQLGDANNSSPPRISEETVVSLFTTSQTLATNSSNNSNSNSNENNNDKSPPLLKALNARCSESRSFLASLFDDAKLAAQEAHASINASEVNEDVLNTLKSFRVITKEERSLEFLKTVKGLEPKIALLLLPPPPAATAGGEVLQTTGAGNSGDGDDQQVVLTLDEATSAYKKIESLITDMAIDEFTAIRSLKSHTQNNLKALEILISSSQALWQHLQSQLDICAAAAEAAASAAAARNHDKNSSSSSNSSKGPISTEEILQLLAQALATRIVNTTVHASITKLLKKSETAAAFCRDQLQHITSVSAEHRAAAVRLLQEYVAAVPLPQDVAEKIRQRNNVLSLVSTCANCIAAHRDSVTAARSASSSSGFPSSPNIFSSSPHTATAAVLASDKGFEISTLRALKYELDLQSGNVGESDTVDIEMLAGIRDDFCLLHWSEEVRLTLSSGTTQAACQNLIKTLLPLYPQLMAEKTGFIRVAEVQEEWLQLQAMLDDADKLAEEEGKYMEVLREAKKSSGEVIRQSNTAAGNVSSDVSSITDPNSVFHFVQAVQSWKTSLGDALVPAIRAHLERVTQSRITLPDVAEKLRGYLAFIELIENASMKVAAIKMAMMPAAATDNNGNNTQAIIHLKELSQLAQTAALASDADPNFLFLKELSSALGAILQEANRWSESTQNLLPNKTTRNKTKSDAKATTKKQLEEALLEPIARAVSTPAHDKILSALSEAATVRAELITCLLPDDNGESSPSRREKEREEKKKRKAEQQGQRKEGDANDSDSDDDDQYDSELYEDNIKFYSLAEKAELLPVDLVEVKVLRWMCSVLTWMQSVPAPKDSPFPGDSPISMESARDRLEEASSGLIDQLPVWLVNELVDLRVMNIDPEKGPLGFHPRTYRHLRRSGELYDYLVEQMKKTEALTREGNVVLQRWDKFGGKVDEANLKVYSHQLQKLHQRMSDLDVQPEPAFRRAVERALQQAGSDYEEYVELSDDDDSASGSPSVLPKAIKKRKSSTSLQRLGEKGTTTAGDKASAAAAQQERKKQKTTTSASALTGHTKTLSGTNFPSPLVLKKKPTLPKCAAGDCSSEIASVGEMYCSDLCAISCAKEVLKGILAVRSQLCKAIWQPLHSKPLPLPPPAPAAAAAAADTAYTQAQAHMPPPSTHPLTLSLAATGNEDKDKRRNIATNAVLADIKAFQIQLFDFADALKDMTNVISKQGYISDVQAASLSFPPLPSNSTPTTPTAPSASSVAADSSSMEVVVEVESAESKPPEDNVAAAASNDDSHNHVALLNVLKATENDYASVEKSQNKIAQEHLAPRLLMGSSPRKAGAGNTPTTTSTSTGSSAATAVVSGGGGGREKNFAMKHLLTALPPAASSLFLHTSDEAAATTAGTPRTPSGGVAAAAAAAAGTTSHTQQEQAQDLRAVSRLSFEDIFISSLLRSGVSAAFSLGAILACDVELEMFYRYAPTGSKKEFDKKEYRKHHLMLVRNLKHKHNDELISRMVRGEVTTDHLLKMAPQELADASTQEMRAKQRAAALKDSTMNVSMADALEVRRRAAMTGAESWRSGVETTSTQESTSSSSAAASAAATSSHTDSATATNGRLERESSYDGGNTDDDSYMDIGGGAASSATSKKSSANAAARTGKRPLNVDAVTRYVSTSSSSSSSDRPKKSARLEAEKDRAESDSHGPLSTMTSSALDRDDDSSSNVVEPDPKLKVPSVLELLKANKSASASSSNLRNSSYDDYGGEQEEQHERGPRPLSALTPSSFFGGSGGGGGGSSSGGESTRFPEGFSMGVSAGGVASSPCKMISSTATYDFTVSHRAAGGAFECTGALIDRRIQGIAKAHVNIDGRIRIDALEKFVNEVCALSRKIMATFCFFVKREHVGSHTPFQRFLDEFIRDKRAGLSNVSEGTTLYLVPAALKGSITALRYMDYGDSRRGSVSETDNITLYGIMISREQGPDEYVYAEPEYFTDAELEMARTPSPLPVHDSSCLVPSPLPGPTVPAVDPRGHHRTAAAAAATTAATAAAITSATASVPAAAVSPPQEMKLQSSSLSSIPEPLPAPQEEVIPEHSHAIPIIKTEPEPAASVPHVPVIVPAPVAVPVVTVSAEAMATIKKVATFCATNPKALDTLTKREESPTVMPFLFEGNPGHREFVEELAKLTAPAVSASSTGDVHTFSAAASASASASAAPNKLVSASGGLHGSAVGLGVGGHAMPSPRSLGSTTGSGPLPLGRGGPGPQGFAMGHEGAGAGRGGPGHPQQQAEGFGRSDHQQQQQPHGSRPGSRFGPR